MNWFSMLMKVLDVAETLIPLARTAVPTLMAAGTEIVATKASPASVQALSTAITTTANSAGLSSGDQAHMQEAATIVKTGTTILGSLAAAGLAGKHVADVQNALDVVGAFADGVTSAAVAPVEPVLAPAV